MTATPLLLLPLALGAPSTPPQPSATPLVVDEFADKLKEAGKDVEKLWKLADWCEARGMTRERDRTLKVIVRQEPDDEKARDLLGHVRFDGQWFTSEKKLESYKKKTAKKRLAAEAKEAKAKGWVRYQGRYVDPAHVPFLERGMVQAEDGTWLTAEEKEKIDAGWMRQDLTWIEPSEASKVEEGLWKCDGKWLDVAAANAFHADLESWWKIPGRIQVWTTCDRELAEKALAQVEDAAADLERLFGVRPPQPPFLLLLRNLEQFKEFTAGNPDEGIPPRSLQGFDSLGGKYFADFWVTEEAGFQGTGVSYWDASKEADNRWGPLWVRHAAGMAFVEALDSSPEARSILMTEGGEAFLRAFWEEKVLPRWLRFGAATYVERYYVDRFVPEDGNPTWTREWSAGEIGRAGGLSSFDQLFELEVSPADDPDSAGHLINQSGLLVAFLLDGQCEPVTEAHDDFKQAMQAFLLDPAKGAKAVKKATADLEKVLGKNRKALLEFAGI